MNGILIADKPSGFTSFDVVAKLRGILDERRLGHGGTLDPMATGVLPIFAGAATKAVDMLPDSTKRYTASARLGVKTDTADITGATLETSGVRCTRAQLEGALTAFIGESEQLPPMYSALKVDGRRLYDLAREGKTVERKPRAIEIYSLELVSFDGDEGEFTIDVRCSKGAYIRTLAEDIAASVGCLAALSELRRTASCGFDETRAHTLDEIQTLAETGRVSELLIPVESAFMTLDGVELDDNLARLFANGCAFEAARLDAPPDEGQAVRVYDKSGFVGIGERRGGRFKKLKQFRS